MIRTQPQGDVIDPLGTQLGYARGVPDRPWLVANFVSTIDGAAVVDGGSTAINDEDDKAMFGALRATADFIVVGAGTVRAENYGPPTLDEKRRSARLAAGLEATPHLAIVTRSLDLEPDHRVFSDQDHRPTILTDAGAPEDRFAALSEVADVVRLKSTTPGEILRYLRLARVVLCEGGPTLMGDFVASGLVDEMALTVSPLLAAGRSPRIAHGAEPETPLAMRLDRVLYGERSLFLRFLRDS
jgi:riboflavin biosynthesis pyrimidine reductase